MRIIAFVLVLGAWEGRLVLSSDARAWGRGLAIDLMLMRAARFLALVCARIQAPDALARPAIFWLPQHVKETRPLCTLMWAMWARLPWRVALALSVTILPGEGSAALVLACLCWVLGDIAFGAMDLPEP